MRPRPQDPEEEAKGRVQSPHPGHEQLPFAHCLVLRPHPRRPRAQCTYNKVSAPAEHLSRHTTVRAGGVLGVQDVTANKSGGGRSASVLSPVCFPPPP